MPSTRELPLVAVDIGNTRTKFGLFGRVGREYPVPERTLALGPGWEAGELQAWLAADAASFRWRVASVNRQETARLGEWFAAAGVTDWQLLGPQDYPLAIEVDEPQQVGLDRLAGAMGANGLRQPERAAIVVDLGSAITVDLVSRGGAFLGGAILPGIAMSAQALHQYTDLLPLEPMSDLEHPPEPLGKTTRGCLQAGLYWGAIGAVGELVRRLCRQADEPELFITGGAGAAAAGLLTDARGQPARLVPHLVLAGIVLMQPAGEARRS